MSNNIVIISGASSGFGAMTARALADQGEVVYAGMRDTDGHNQSQAQEANDYSAREQVELHPLELDVQSDESVAAAIDTVIDREGRIDVLVHNAGHMVVGPSEAFTPEQFAELYDVNLLGTQRLNRAALPHMRAREAGLLVWVSSTSVKGGTPPYLGPYFAAKAGMDSLAVTYAGELARFGIETSIVVPGSFTHGTNHFAHSGHPDDDAVAKEYEVHYAGLMEQVAQKLADLAPPDQDPAEVAREIARIVGLPHGERPYRVPIDPADDGSERVSDVAHAARAEAPRRGERAPPPTPASPR